jgi:hypothetical protein
LKFLDPLVALRLLAALGALQVVPDPHRLRDELVVLGREELRPLVLGVIGSFLQVRVPRE